MFFTELITGPLIEGDQLRSPGLASF